MAHSVHKTPSIIKTDRYGITPKTQTKTTIYISYRSI